MEITLESHYAIRILLTLYESDERRRTLEILEECHIPIKLGQKIVTKLVKAELLYSVRGLNGGIEPIRKPENISLYDVIGVTQKIKLKKCDESIEGCKWNCNNCLLNNVIEKIKVNYLEELRETKFSKML